MLQFSPYLLQRLVSAPGQAGAAFKPMLTLDQLKDTVAADLQALLNTRRGLHADDLQGFPQLRRSVLAFGLDDFSSRSMANTEDQAFICDAIAKTSAVHEPRLRDVQVELRRRDASTQRLRFLIRARLMVHPMSEPVNFDAVLQTGQTYAVTQAGRLQEAGGA